MFYFVLCVPLSLSRSLVRILCCLPVSGHYGGAVAVRHKNRMNIASKMVVLDNHVTIFEFVRKVFGRSLITAIAAVATGTVLASQAVTISCAKHPAVNASDIDSNEQANE